MLSIKERQASLEIQSNETQSQDTCNPPGFLPHGLDIIEPFSRHRHTPLSQHFLEILIINPCHTLYDTDNVGKLAQAGLVLLPSLKQGMRMAPLDPAFAVTIGIFPNNWAILVKSNRLHRDLHGVSWREICSPAA